MKKIVLSLVFLLTVSVFGVYCQQSAPLSEFSKDSIPEIPTYTDFNGETAFVKNAIGAKMIDDSKVNREGYLLNYSASAQIIGGSLKVTPPIHYDFIYSGIFLTNKPNTNNSSVSTSERESPPNVLTQGIIDQSGDKFITISSDDKNPYAVVSIRNQEYVAIGNGTIAWEGSVLQFLGSRFIFIKLTKEAQQYIDGRWIGSDSATFEYWNESDVRQLTQFIEKYFDLFGFSKIIGFNFEGEQYGSIPSVNNWPLYAVVAATGSPNGRITLIAGDNGAVVPDEVNQTKIAARDSNTAGYKPYTYGWDGFLAEYNAAVVHDRANQTKIAAGDSINAGYETFTDEQGNIVRGITFRDANGMKIEIRK